MSLSTQVLLGLALGGATGLFLGELAAPLDLVGRGFVMLLQMTVIPYVAVSLIAGLGSLSYDEAGLVARRAGGFLLVLWGTALVAVMLVPLAFPVWESASYFSRSLVSVPEETDFLALYIPANPFYSLSASIVPAVVVFSVALGVALIATPGKEPLVRGLEVLSNALLSIASFVVRLAPFGVFAIVANASGTLEPTDLAGLQVYAVVYMGLALVLAAWAIPMLVATLTPFTYRELVFETRDALITAFATGSVVVVLAVLAERSRELLQGHDEASAEATRLVGVVLPASYNFPSAGKLLVLSFLLYAGWISGYAISAAELPTLLGAGSLSLFGSNMMAVPFLLDLFRIPSDLFQFFVIADSLFGSRFSALVAAGHLLAVTLLTTCSAAGLIQVSWPRIARWALVTLGLFLAVVLGVRATFEAVGRDYEQYRLYVDRSSVLPAADVTHLDAPPEDLPSVDVRRLTLDRIRERGSLRVGYFADSLPFAFRGSQGRVVGIDAEMAHQLARELDVGLEFVRVERKGMPALLDAGYLDVVMSGMAITTDRMESVSFSTAYMDQTLALVLEDHRLAGFGSVDAIRSMDGLRIAVPDVPYYVEKIRTILPEAELVTTEIRSFFRQKNGEFDALLFTAEAGSAWTLVYPQYGVVVPHPARIKVPVAYAVRRGDKGMAAFMSRWVELKQKDGTVDQLFDYWIAGREVEKSTERWSIIRDVLGWIE